MSRSRHRNTDRIYTGEQGIQRFRRPAFLCGRHLGGPLSVTVIDNGKFDAAVGVILLGVEPSEMANPDDPATQAFSHL